MSCLVVGQEACRAAGESPRILHSSDVAGLIGTEM